MRTSLILFLLLPLIAMSEEIYFSVGMSHAEASAIIKKHSGKDITSGLALGGSGQAGLYWSFGDYDAVVELPSRDGKISSITYWTKKNFGESKNHRAETAQRVTTLKLDTKTKSVSMEKAEQKKG